MPHIKKFLLLLTLLTVSIAITLLIPRRESVKNSEVVIYPESSDASVPTVLLSGLEIPWEIVFINENKVLITERPGRLLLFDSTATSYQVKDVFHSGEGGLLGIALHPDFGENQLIYLYYTYKDGGSTLNKVSQFTFSEDGLSNEQILISGIVGASYHDGGRIKFGPDGKLYVTTGDHGDKSSPQDLDSLSGKILRLNDDGTIPKDNPFNNSYVYSYGHRNVQGIDWDSNGNFWATEHGPQGEDEVNLIKAGGNYGWPDVSGSKQGEGMISPVVQSGLDTWAPSGATIYNGKLYFAGLAGRAIYSLDLETKQLSKFAEGEFGRIRTIVVGPDGDFYILTSNRDGRNDQPSVLDDRLIRIPALFFSTKEMAL